MKGVSPRRDQPSFMIQGLKEMCNPRDPLYQLADRFPWDKAESWFEDKYAINGRPAKPVRLTVLEKWVYNPHMQNFSGETEFQRDMRCEPSDLVHFRNRIVLSISLMPKSSYRNTSLQHPL